MTMDLRLRMPATALLTACLLLVPSVRAQDKAKPVAAVPPAVSKAATKPPERIDTLRRIRDTGILTLGVRESSVPFSFVDGQKQPQGYSVDLCLRIADTIKAELKLPKLDVRFLSVSSSNRIPMLVDGRIDLECGSTTNTHDWQKQVAFGYTTFVAGIKMLARRSDNIASIEDLRGRNIVVTKGTTSEKIVQSLNAERMLNMKIIAAADHVESFKAVEDGKAVAFPMDDVVLYGLISKSKKPDDFAVVGKYLSVEPYAIMLRRDEPAFERLVNRALIDLFQSGEIKRLYAKWFNTKDLIVPLNQYLREAFATPNTYPAWP
ncbi:MAG: amino acid ABC transporter substrate-binding protein [Casimicrobiaceae bacterium]